MCNIIVFSILKKNVLGLTVLAHTESDEAAADSVRGLGMGRDIRELLLPPSSGVRS